MSGDQLNLDDIEARAKRADTTHRWEVDSHAHIENGCRCLSCYGPSTIHQLNVFLDCEEVPQFDEDAERCIRSGFATYEDAAHAAGMDPTTTIALVAEVRRLRSLLDDAGVAR